MQTFFVVQGSSAHYHHHHASHVLIFSIRYRRPLTRCCLLCMHVPSPSPMNRPQITHEKVECKCSRLFITALPPRPPPAGIIVGRTLHLHSPLIDDALVTCANHPYLPCLRVINACTSAHACLSEEDALARRPYCAVPARPYCLHVVPERIPVGLFLRPASWWAFTCRCVVRALPWWRQPH
jgi:hypothetical protein